MKEDNFWFWAGVGVVVMAILLGIIMFITSSHISGLRAEVEAECRRVCDLANLTYFEDVITYDCKCIDADCIIDGHVEKSEECFTKFVRFKDE